MSSKQFKTFLEAVKVDTGLQEKLKEAADADAVVEIAKTAGFVISADELKTQTAESLSDKDLEGMAGGNWWQDGCIGTDAAITKHTCHKAGPCT